MDNILPGPEPEADVKAIASKTAPPGMDVAVFIDQQARRRRAILIETWYMIAKRTAEAEAESNG